MNEAEHPTSAEYLVSYGNAGDFGRFRAAQPLPCRRGDRVVIHSHRGLELGAVLCEARPGHARFLPNTSVGHLLRFAGDDDEQTARQRRAQSQQLFTESRRLIGELALPLEVLDAELLLDGRQAILHYLRWAEGDERPLVSSLSKQFDVFIALHDLRLPVEPPADDAHGHGGCGAEGCGGGGCASAGGGHCSGCGIAGLLHDKRAAKHSTPASTVST